MVDTNKPVAPETHGLSHLENELVLTAIRVWGIAEKDAREFVAYVASKIEGKSNAAAILSATSATVSAAGESLGSIAATLPNGEPVENFTQGPISSVTTASTISTTAEISSSSEPMGSTK